MPKTKTPEFSNTPVIFGFVMFILIVLCFYFVFIFIPTYVYRRSTKFEKIVTVKYTSNDRKRFSRRTYDTFIDTDGNSYKTSLPFDSIHVGKKYKLKGHGSNTITSAEQMN
jgi:hypothetical protein